MSIFCNHHVYNVRYDFQVRDFLHGGGGGGETANDTPLPFQFSSETCLHEQDICALLCKSQPRARVINPLAALVVITSLL